MYSLSQNGGKNLVLKIWITKMYLIMAQFKAKEEEEKTIRKKESNYWKLFFTIMIISKGAVIDIFIFYLATIKLYDKAISAIFGKTNTDELIQITDLSVSGNTHMILGLTISNT